MLVTSQTRKTRKKPATVPGSNPHLAAENWSRCHDERGHRLEPLADRRECEWQLDGSLVDWTNDVPTLTQATITIRFRLVGDAMPLDWLHGCSFRNSHPHDTAFIGFRAVLLWDAIDWAAGTAVYRLTF